MHINQKNILITGLVRNNQGTLRKTLSVLKKASVNFNSVHWLIIESDSVDKSAEILQEISTREAKFKYISLGDLTHNMPLRTERLAYCRNKYLSEIKNNPEYLHIDYVLIADMDGVNNILTESALLSCWQRDDWAVCTANQTGKYYDIWALRHTFLSPNDCWEYYHFLKKMGLSSSKSKRNAIDSRMIEIHKNSEWIEVESAFGGLGVYKKEALCSSNYIGLNPGGVEVCEHVSLNRNITQKGHRIFINPQLINSSLNEHSSLTIAILKKIKSLFKKIWH